MILVVPYKDKDIVKALGARWNGKEWIVPEGVSPERFTRWAKKDGSENSIVSKESSANIKSNPLSVENKGLDLSTFLFEISDAVRRAVPVSQWVKAEISNVRKTAAGHYYIELVEHDLHGKELAKINAIIWSSQNKIVKNFEKETGVKFEAGLKILCLAKPEFSIQYGMSLQLDNLDSSWTLGEMEKKVIQIRKELTDLGLIDLNKQKDLPLLLEEIIILAPEGAAGLGDFLADALSLEKYGLLKIKIINATFEGPSSSASLVRAFNEIEQTKFGQAICMIRGGGATSGLNWLNDLPVAMALAQCTKPVLIGIGHERDKTVLDEIAYQSFDTPSKVIAFVYNYIRFFWDKLENNYRTIEKQVVESLNSFDQAIKALKQLIEMSHLNKVKRLDEQLGQYRNTIDSSAIQKIQLIDQMTKNLMHLIVNLGPEKTMKRGFSMVKDSSGRLVGKENMPQINQELQVQSSHFNLTVSVKSINQ